MQCGYRETLVSTRDLATKPKAKQGQGNILFHDQLTDTEHGPLHEWRSLLSKRQFSTEARKIP